MSFLIFPKIDSDAPRQKTVHGGLCLDECVANTIGNYFQCSTQWWMYNKVRSMNWDLCSIGNYTGKLLLLCFVLLFYKVNSSSLSEGNTLKDHTFQLTCLVKWTWSMILGCLQTPKMSTFQQVNRSMKKRFRRQYTKRPHLSYEMDLINDPRLPPGPKDFNLPASK